MPKYSYYCHECKNTYDVVHSWNEKLDKCKVCNSLRLQKLVSNFSITQKQHKTEIDGTIKINKQKIQKMKEKIKQKTFEDIKND